MYIFLDCSRDLYFARNFLKISVTIGVFAIVLIFGLVWFFSSIIVKPIAESYSKQKRFITNANHEIKNPLAIIGATNVVEPFKNLAKVSNKTLNVSIENDLKAIDEVSLIGQLVSILLENAFKYSNRNGTVDFFLTSNGKNKKIIVANTTDGVDKKNLDKLFDRFYRTDDSRNSETGGNGIGLSIAKSIVNIHKGKINVKSDDRIYIVFRVIL